MSGRDQQDDEAQRLADMIRACEYPPEVERDMIACINDPARKPSPATIAFWNEDAIECCMDDALEAETENKPRSFACEREDCPACAGRPLSELLAWGIIWAAS